MKVVILAGGKGTRLAEETATRPKPMVEIGGKPILWHVMNIYAAHGYKDFLVACGYMADMIKEYFLNLSIHQHDFVLDMSAGTREVLNDHTLDWKIGLIDTGPETMTGGRVRRLATWLTSTFMVTYGDGVGDVDITALVAFHRSHGKLATVTAVHPPARFGSLVMDGDAVRCFSEKLQTDADWINGGFFVFEPGALGYLDGDHSVLERDPLERLAADGQLMAYRHAGFWQPMDTLREKMALEALWASGEAPWRIRP